MARSRQTETQTVTAADVGTLPSSVTAGLGADPPAPSDNREVTTTRQRPVANLETNFFEQFASDIGATRMIRGRMLKCSKGDWLAGEDNAEIAKGTKLVANMDQLLVGWVKWADGKPERQVMGLVSEGFVAPARETLGDVDESLWEVWPDGRPNDPWVRTFYMIMKDPEVEVESEEQLFTFTTSSDGGARCVADIAAKYGRRIRTNPDDVPVVELGVEVYEHAVYGRIKKPTMKVVGWESKEKFGDAKDLFGAAA